MLSCLLSISWKSILLFTSGSFFSLIALFLISIAAGSTHGLSESILLLAKRFSGLKILPHRDYDGW